MGYIGNQTSNSYSSLAKQTITGDGGTGYTLDHAVANAQEVEVFVNNVRQEPGTAYTVSGTTLTMTGNVASTDDFYVVYQGKAIQTSVPGDNTVTTAMLQNDAITTAKVADDAITSALIADDAVKIAHINEDFYKTGSWTPAVSSGVTITSYDEQNGFYVKVGDMVTAWGQVEYNGSSRTGSHFKISGLPFTSSSATDRPTYGGIITYQNGFSSSHNTIYVPRGSTEVRFYELDGSTLIGSELSGANGNLRFVVFYTV